MANANIDALYVGSLKIKISYFFSEKFYKWCVTKVAHCIYYSNFDKNHYKDFHRAQCTEHTPLALNNFQHFSSNQVNVE